MNVLKQKTLGPLFCHIIYYTILRPKTEKFSSVLLSVQYYVYMMW